MTPTSYQDTLLPSGITVPLGKVETTFKPWTGIQPADTYGKKLVLEFDGRMAFAELAILWTLRESGWFGVWIDTYRGVYWTDYWNCKPVKQLPSESQSVLDQIRNARGGLRRGTWDVFCWRDGECLFAESKWKGHDRIRPDQLLWLEAALGIGLPLSSFLIVEWTTLTSTSFGDPIGP